MSTLSANEREMIEEKRRKEHKINSGINEEKNIITEPHRGAHFCNVQKNKRFDIYVFKGTGAKSKLFRYLDTDDGKNLRIVAQINDTNGYRQFIAFPSWAYAWNKYIHTGYNKRFMYEMIISNPTGNRPCCKPYLDIEWLYEKYQDPDTFIQTLLADIKDIFLNRYHKVITDDEILISKSHKFNIKYSFHLTITPKDKLLVYKTNRHRHNNSAWDLYIALMEKNKDYYFDKIDGAVYTLDREMRCLYSTKFYNDISGESARHLVPLVPCNKRFIDNYLDYFITNIDREYEYIKTPIYKENYCEDDFKKFKTNKFKGLKKYNEKETDNFIIIRILELLRQRIHQTAVYTGIVGEDHGYRFTYQDRSEPCYTGYTHKSNGFGVYLKNNTGFFYMCCFSMKCRKTFKLGHLYDDITWDIGALEINQPFIEYHYNIKDLKDSIINLNMQSTCFINDFITNQGIIAIKSPMGTGKTQCLKCILKTDDFKNLRTLYLSHRQTFSNNIEGSFKELNFFNYMHH